MKQLLILTAVIWSFNGIAQETIEFPSKDGIQITADVYTNGEKNTPFIVLFHQAGYSRGEYIEIAPKLNAMGFNCMAVDLRSGNKANGIENRTTQKAKAENLPTGYTDAFQDIEAAVGYVKQNLATGDVIIWGSSYSSSLVLKYAGDFEGVQAVLSFSPGEYFTREGKPGDYVTSSASNIKCPSFITSKKSEKKNWWEIQKAIQTDSKTYYLPESEGRHGSSALWSSSNYNEGYWEAVTAFLNPFATSN